jgi:hypothetical protein
MLPAKYRAIFSSVLVSSGTLLSACGGSCPSADSASDVRSEWERQLDAKNQLPLRPKAEIDIKRDVHNLVVSAEAGALAQAFHETMKNPNNRFGLIRVDRKAANIGQDFKVGERFQGRYELDKALAAKLPEKWREHFGDVAEDPPWCEILWKIENSHTSDYGVITELMLTPQPGGEYRMAYAYLDGSPIAGSSTFTIVPVSPTTSRVTQIFLYQEQTADFARFFSSGGLRLHNQVVYSQVEQSAKLIGARIVESDIPEEYAKL